LIIGDWAGEGRVVEVGMMSSPPIAWRTAGRSRGTRSWLHGEDAWFVGRAQRLHRERPRRGGGAATARPGARPGAGRAVAHGTASSPRVRRRRPGRARPRPQEVTGPMPAIVSTIEIAASPDDVFAYATDPSRFAGWQDDVVAVRVEEVMPLASGRGSRPPAGSAASSAR